MIRDAKCPRHPTGIVCGSAVGVNDFSKRLRLHGKKEKAAHVSGLKSDVLNAR
jgi:hypothetical protein